MAQRSNNKAVGFLERDVFAIIWIVFLVLIIYLTMYRKEYIKDMITVSILFLVFLLIEPLVRLAHGSKITKKISRGREVPYWKRFPLFLAALLFLFVIERGLEAGIEESFPTESVNFILVLFWLISLFLFYYLIYSKHAEEPVDLIPGQRKRKQKRFAKLKEK
jgi:hypothetical protein